MFKVLFAGLVFGLGLMIAIGGVTLYGLSILSESVQQVAAEMTKFEGDLDPSMDDLEVYRECLLTNYAGDPTEAVLSCAIPMRTWRGSPTFEAEWRKLMGVDAQVRMIIGAYNAQKKSA